ncbi:MAG: DUF4332 domain-containing protein [Pseudomonadota bacterium]
MTDLTVIEGIGPAYAERLVSAGVSSCAELLVNGASRAGRAQLSAASGMSNALILKFVNHADLCRVSGIVGEYAELLEAAGVDGVPALAQLDARNLTAKLRQINQRRQLVRTSPGEALVSTWVEHAKRLPRLVFH